jgi:hypothetical protein
MNINKLDNSRFTLAERATTYEVHTHTPTVVTHCCYTGVTLL